jgi:carboxyl-terminal processing protease
VNRKNLKKKYKNFQVFKAGFKVDEALMNEFKAFAEKEKITFDEKGFNASRRVIETRLKAGIASDLFDYGAFYEIINDLNPIYKKGIEAIQNDTFDKMKLVWGGN